MSCVRTRSVPALILIVVFLWAGPGQAAEIHDAVSAGDVAKVTALLDADPAQANAAGEDGLTPLHLAAFAGHAELTRLLLAHGAAVDAVGGGLGFTALHFAAYAGRAEAIRALLDSKASLDVESGATGATPLHLAVYSRDAAAAALLLGAGAEVNSRDRMGFSPLSLAVNFGKTEIAALLIEGGADVNAVDGPGRTPLTLAAQRGNAEIARLLLAGGAAIDAPDGNGETPLLAAVRAGRAEVIDALLQGGARRDVTDSASGRSALHLACVAGNPQVVRLLAEAGLPLDAADAGGSTPLELACRYGHRSAAQILIGAGAQRGRCEEESFGPAPELSRPLGPGEAVAWRLHTRGWAVKTPRHLLVFDAETFGAEPPPEPSLANGFLAEREIGAQKVFALYTAYHGDVGELSCIHDLEDALAEVTYVHHRGDRFRGARNSVYLEPGARESLGALDLTSVDTFDGNVSQAYLCRIDGLSLFYAGSHPQDRARYRESIANLAREAGPVDLAFLPVPEPGEGLDELVYEIERLSPRTVILHDPQRRAPLLADTTAALRERVRSVRVLHAGEPGDHFLLGSGAAEPSSGS